MPPISPVVKGQETPNNNCIDDKVERSISFWKCRLLLENGFVCNLQSLIWMVGCATLCSN